MKMEGKIQLNNEYNIEKPNIHSTHTHTYIENVQILHHVNFNLNGHRLMVFMQNIYQKI